MNAAVERWPLSWPAGWPRAKGPRARAKFHGTTQRGGADGYSVFRDKRPLTVAEAISRLQGELDRLGARAVTLSTNIELRLDGLPMSGRREPDDPGVAVYFQLTGKPVCLACDKWDRVADNIAALAGHIDAIRTQARYGVGSVARAFAGYTALPPARAASASWWEVLGVSPDATLDEIEDRHRSLLRRCHPDAGGSNDEMARVNAARDAARAERGA